MKNLIIVFLMLSIILFILGGVFYFQILIEEIRPHSDNYRLRDAALYTSCSVFIVGFLGLFSFLKWLKK
jgi:hypothetical protein